MEMRRRPTDSRSESSHPDVSTEVSPLVTSAVTSTSHGANATASPENHRLSPPLLSLAPLSTVAQHVRSQDSFFRDSDNNNNSENDWNVDDNDDSFRRDRPLWGRLVSRWITAHCMTNSTNKDTNATTTTHRTPPSLEQAWDYFEYSVLPRRQTHPPYRKAPPGRPRRSNADSEKDDDTHTTQLYSAWGTPQRELRDFGTGIAVYFATLRALVVVCGMAYLLYWPSLRYYQSEAYRGPHYNYNYALLSSLNLSSSSSSNGLMGNNLTTAVEHLGTVGTEAVASMNAHALYGSLACSRTAWVPCPTCNPETDDLEAHRLAKSMSVVSSGSNATEPLYFVLSNECAPMRWQEGVNHLVVVLFLVASMVALGFYQKRLELQYDEERLSAQDFSIVVDNAPRTATDPADWIAYFGQFGPVVYCTVALDNEALVAALVQRRVLLQKARFSVVDGDDFDNDSNAGQVLPPSLRQDDRWVAALAECDRRCHHGLQRSYDATSVFVTFDTELAQRNALTALTVSQMALATNDASGLRPEHRFVAKRCSRHENQMKESPTVLQVEEAAEPSEVRWPDLNETTTVRVCQRVTTCALTGALIYAGFATVKWGFHIDVRLAAVLIALLNVAVPNILKFVNKLESHAGESSYQASLFAKVSIFRFVNTAIVTTVIQPFTATIANDSVALIPAIYTILKAEIITAPLIHMLDIVGHIKRHILAPRAKNQAAMNSYFTGSKQNLGEKYTNMTKIIFLCFFYSVLFPSGFLFGAVAIAATYVTDKFQLMRTWGRLPELGDDVAKLSRRVFFPLCLVALTVLSEFYWSAYPFDNVCDSDTVVSPTGEHANFIGRHQLTTLADTPTTAEVSLVGDGSEKVYRYCDQDYLERLSTLLNFYYMEKDDWMSRDQQVLSFLFGVCCVGAVVIVAVIALVYDLFPQLKGVVQASFSTLERDSGERYIDQDDVQAYVPQVRHPKIAYPLLACDISNIDPQHIGWSDPFHDHDFYSLQADVDYLMDGDPLRGPALSIVRRSHTTVAPRAEQPPAL